LRAGWSLLSLVFLLLLAAGCALPPAVTIASFAADGVSYVATGKSVTDHGLSAATGEDCALLRPVLSDKPVCSMKETAAGKAVPVEYRASPAAAPKVVRTRYVMVGSFLDPANAARAVARYAPLAARIVPAEVHGRHFHRVMVGPLSDEEARLKLRLAAN
jgi:cell division septation protein DedD